jgi:alkanesulfonate monooxygenase SsuD/methylene tetrahydromethanopterin reductase-like flavin-dependent oxidoreductase (luciferase family)
VQIGITLPTFSPDAAGVIDAARAAEEAGIDGVFVFDHLWPMGNPARPSLSLYPIAGAVIAATSTIRVGTLVARVGLLPDEVVLASLGGLAQLAEGRLIAAIGTGDSSSADENERLGIPYPSAGSRRQHLAGVAGELRRAGIETWIGGGAAATNQIARATGSTLNLWGASPELLRRSAAAGYEVSWAGPLPKDGSASSVLRSVAQAGATWSVWGWPQSLELVLVARQAAGIETTWGSM